MQKLLGSVARAALEQKISAHLDAIAARGEQVKIALFRVGERPDDVGYERSILRACGRLGILAEQNVFDADVSEDELVRAIETAGKDPETDGILVFRPLPKTLSSERIVAAVPAEKDIDGALLSESRFTPCTPEACMHLLDAYGIPVSGRHCVVVGRSPVVGKPLAELLRNAGADVAVCHTQTPDVPAETRKAELLFVACGKPKMIGKNYLSEGQTVIDVGFHADETGFCGDVDADAAEALAAAYTPVPGGVGAVTLTVLLWHGVLAHEGRKK